MNIAFTHRRSGGSVIEDGTEQHPFLIKTVQDFVNFRNEHLSGNQHSGLHFKLVNNIDLQGVSFVQGINEPYFYGVFDGNFKTIKNFVNDTRRTYEGLFITLGNTGIVRNLGLKDINFYKNVGTSDFYGGIIGVFCYGVVEKCYVTGQANVPNAFGSIASYINGGIVRNCWSDVSIQGNQTRSGGINRGSNSYSGVQPMCENCIALGNINNFNNATANYVGGVSATANQPNTTKNCVAAMNSIVAGANLYKGRIIATQPIAMYVNINNYALDTMTINGTIPTTNIGATQLNGASATEQQLKSTAFYRDVMGWDMDTIWEIETEGVTFPRLRGFNYNF